MNEDVARIIGWNPEPLKRDCVSCMAEVEFFDAPYTADDLAAWLRKHDWSVSIYPFANAEFADGTTMTDGWIADAEAGTYPDLRQVGALAPTILDCLEQLVTQIGAS